VKPRLLLGVALASVAGAASAEDLAAKLIMAMQVNPAATAFWAGGNDPPDNETPYAAQIRWDAAIKGAQTMQEKGRLLQSAGVSHPGAWNGFAQMMITIAKEGEAAARAHDAEKSFEIGARLYDACNGCHKTYVPRTPPP